MQAEQDNLLMCLSLILQNKACMSADGIYPWCAARRAVVCVSGMSMGAWPADMLQSFPPDSTAMRVPCAEHICGGYARIHDRV